jgi:DNA-binding protein HU-beta
VNRNELVAGVASKAGIPRNQAEKVLDALGDVVTEAVHKGDKVSLTGLLSIERVLRAPRTGRNPQTGEPLSIPAGYSVRLSCGSRLKAAARGNHRTISLRTHLARQERRPASRLQRWTTVTQYGVVGVGRFTPNRALGR